MNTGPARGMRDFLPADLRRRQFVIGVIADVYQRYGFEPLETPAVENIETLTGKYGEEGNKLIYKVLRRGEGEASGEADLALRYDLTVPLARVVIGGLLASTLITLVFVPTVYTIFEEGWKGLRSGHAAEHS